MQVGAFGNATACLWERALGFGTHDYSFNVFSSWIVIVSPCFYIMCSTVAVLRHDFRGWLSYSHNVVRVRFYLLLAIVCCVWTLASVIYFGRIFLIGCQPGKGFSFCSPDSFHGCPSGQMVLPSAIWVSKKPKPCTDRFDRVDLSWIAQSREPRELILYYRWDRCSLSLVSKKVIVQERLYSIYSSIYIYYYIYITYKQYV